MLGGQNSALASAVRARAPARPGSRPARTARPGGCAPRRGRRRRCGATRSTSRANASSTLPVEQVQVGRPPSAPPRRPAPRRPAPRAAAGSTPWVRRSSSTWPSPAWASASAGVVGEQRPGRRPPPRPGRRARWRRRPRRSAGRRPAPRPRRARRPPAATRPVTPLASATRSSSSRYCRTCASGRAPWKSGIGWPLTTANTAGMLCTWKAWPSRGLASTSTLASSHRPLVGVGQPLEHRAQLLARAAPVGPEVDDDGHGHRLLDHDRLEVGLGDVDDHAARGRGGPAGRRPPGGRPAPTGRRRRTG